MPKRISMRDIAARAGVSVMTVSLALRDSMEVSRETRKRIQELAKKMGFQPDPALRALIHYRKTRTEPRQNANTIAFVNNTSHPTSLPLNEIYRFPFEGAAQRAKELGYKLEEFWLGEPGLTPKRASLILQTRGVRGLIIAPQEKSHSSIDLCWESFSAVAIGLSMEWPRLHVIINNMFKQMLLCMQRLVALGYRRIGLAICREQDERAEHRYIGAYRAAGEDFPNPIPILRPVVPEREEFLAWFRKYRPEVVVGTEKQFADYLTDAGFRIPEDVGFAAVFATEPLSRYSHVNGNGIEIGRAAAELVSSMIDRNETGIPASPRLVLIEPEWVMKESVRQIRDSPRAGGRRSSKRPARA